VEAVTGVKPSPDFDPIYGYPQGYVSYSTGSGAAKQIYPADAAPAPLVASNPIKVKIKDVDATRAAVRDGFVPVAGLTLQFGSPVNNPLPDATNLLVGGFYQHLRAYYEILEQFRVSSFLPATPTTTFGYHPLTPTDTSAFDGINLDEGFYQFLDNTDIIKKKK
jgi:hypothetical protein